MCVGVGRSPHHNTPVTPVTPALTQAARSGLGLAEVQVQLGEFIEQYALMASGPTKWQRLAEFLRDTYGAVSQEVLSRSDKEGREK